MLARLPRQMPTRLQTVKRCAHGMQHRLSEALPPSWRFQPHTQTQRMIEHLKALDGPLKNPSSPQTVAGRWSHLWRKMVNENLGLCNNL